MSLKELMAKRKELYNQIYKSCLNLMDYVNDPDTTVKAMQNNYSQSGNMELAGKFKSIEEGLAGAFTREHAMELGKKTIVEEIKSIELAIKNISGQLKDQYKLLAASIRDEVDILFHTIELNNPIKNIQSIQQDRIMVGYFESKLIEISQMEFFKIIKTNCNTKEALVKAPQVFNRFIEIYTEKLIRDINAFKDKTDILKAGFETQSPDGPTNVLTKYGEIGFVEPKTHELQIAWNNLGAVTVPDSIVFVYSKFIEYIASVLPVIKEKADLLINCLDRISNAEFTLFTAALDNMLYSGAYKFEKIEITIEEYQKLLLLDNAYIEMANDKVDLPFILGLERAISYVRIMNSTFIQFANVVYQCFNKAL